MVIVMVFIYRIFYIHVQLRFTLLQCKGEIKHQLILAYISIYNRCWKLPLATSSNPRNHEIAQRPDQHTGNSMPYSSRLVCGFFNVPQGYEHWSVVSVVAKTMYIHILHWKLIAMFFFKPRRFRGVVVGGGGRGGREGGGDEGEGVGGCLVQILSFLLSHLTETWQQWDVYHK